MQGMMVLDLDQCDLLYASGMVYKISSTEGLIPRLALELTYSTCM